MKSGRSGTLKRSRLSLSGIGIKCSDAGAGDFDVLPTYVTPPMVLPCRLNPPRVEIVTSK